MSAPPPAAPTPQAALQTWSSGQRSSQVEVLLYHNPFHHLSRTRLDGDLVPSWSPWHPLRNIFGISFRRASRGGEARAMGGGGSGDPLLNRHRASSPLVSVSLAATSLTITRSLFAWSRTVHCRENLLHYQVVFFRISCPRKLQWTVTLHYSHHHHLYPATV